jgi:uncharacterized membrane protein
MSETLSRGPSRTASSEDRALAIAVYVLLFLSPFFFGLTGLIGGVLALARLGQADTLTRSHYAFQGRIFWIAIAGFLASVVLMALGGSVMIAHIFQLALRQGGGWDGWDASFSDGSNGHLNLGGLGLFLLGLIGLVADCLWLMLASVFGGVRLASDQPIGTLKRA